jgi:hypothetical protein
MLTCRKVPTKTKLVRSALTWMRVARVLVLFLLSLHLLPACERCSSATYLAKLSAREGSVDRDTKEKVEQWSMAEVGSTYSVGDGIRTGNKSRAELTLDDGSVLGLEEDTLIRFLDRPPGSTEQALDLQVGSASLEASSEGAVLRTLFGQASLEAGTRIRLERSDEGVRFNIRVGSATLESTDGDKLELKAGQTIEIKLGGAVMEVIDDFKKEEEKPTDPAEATPSVGPLLASVQGGKVRLKAPTSRDFAALTPGETSLAAGSVLEVGAQSSVVVTSGDQKATLAAGGTYIVGAGEQLVSAQSGSVEVSSEGKVQIQVPGGVIVTNGGSSTITALGKQGTKVKALSGQVTLKGKGEETISSGEEGILSLQGDISVEGRGISYADVDTTVGENLVIHDPRPPTAVRFLFGKACEIGVIRLNRAKSSLPGGNHARGSQSVALTLAPGKTPYSLHCIDESGREGPPKITAAITVLQDGGSRPVPKEAPSTFVEVNGRAYTVLYQNQLPRVTFKWSKAPPDAASFKLHLRGPSGSRTISASSPTHSFASGALGEGTHTVHFEGGGQLSRQTSVTILFDNATPTASLTTPSLSGAKPGSEITLAGTALPGWDVEVDGKSVGQDAGSRFSVKTQVPESGRPVSVRLTHPTRGTHVYLRRGAE